jgi:hypothetical protein
MLDAVVGEWLNVISRLVDDFVDYRDDAERIVGRDRVARTRYHEVCPARGERRDLMRPPFACRRQRPQLVAGDRKPERGGIRGEDDQRQSAVAALLARNLLICF